MALRVVSLGVVVIGAEDTAVGGRRRPAAARGLSDGEEPRGGVDQHPADRFGSRRDALDLVAVVQRLQAIPDADAAAEHDRHLDHVQVVDQARGEEVANHAGAAADPDVEAHCGAWIATNLAGFTGVINLETIGGRIIEVHLRFADQWPDLYGTGWVEGTLPQWAYITALVGIGTLIGARFGAIKLRTIGGHVVAALGSFAVAVSISAAFVIVLTLTTSVRFGDLVVAFAPGAMDAMLALALTLHIDPVFVGAHHLARFMFVSVVTPGIVHLFGKAADDIDD